MTYFEKAKTTSDAISFVHFTKLHDELVDVDDCSLKCVKCIVHKEIVNKDKVY